MLSCVAIGKLVATCKKVTINSGGLIENMYFIRNACNKKRKKKQTMRKEKTKRKQVREPIEIDREKFQNKSD